MFPKIFSWGDFFLPTYGVLVAAGFLTALWMAARLARRYGLSPETISSLGVNSAIVGLIGAKLLYIILDSEQWTFRSIFSLATLQTGGVFFGGLVGALLYAGYYIRRHHLPALPTLDSFGPGIALGHSIGRLGCFAAGCCWGTSCDRSWAVTFTSHDAHDLVGVPLNVPLHPTQLYESIAQFLAFLLLYALATRRHRPGQVIAGYLFLGGLSRLIIDFWRANEQRSFSMGAPMSDAQWLSIGLMVAACVIWSMASSKAVVRLSPDATQAQT